MSADNVETELEGNAQRPPALQGWWPGTELSALSPRETRVWWIDLDFGLKPDQVDVVEPGPELAVLTDDERARSARFVRARDRRRFARCRASLRQIMGTLMGESAPSLRFRAMGHGKPELDLESMHLDKDDGRAALRFNVTHSSNLALIGVCHGLELGVDVERIKEMSDMDRIVESVFSPAECSEYATLPAQVKQLAFFRGWTRKEAVLKGFGIGLAGLSALYETGFGTTPLPAHFIPADPAPQIQEWQLWEAAPCPGFVAAVAIDRVQRRNPGEPARRAAAVSSLPA